MNNTFGSLTQHFIKTTLSKNNTSFLELLMFHSTRGLKPKKYFRVLSFVIYTMIDNYVCIVFLDCQVKFLWILNMLRNILTEDWVLELHICY